MVWYQFLIVGGRVIFLDFIHSNRKEHNNCLADFQNCRCGDDDEILQLISCVDGEYREAPLQLSKRLLKNIIISDVPVASSKGGIPKMLYY